MSAEWWGDPEDQRIRLALCGHVILAQELPDAALLGDVEPFHCPVCEHSHTETRSYLLSVRDGVPCSSSRWGSSSCQLRLQLADRRSAQECVANIEALLKRMSSPSTTRIVLPPKTLDVKPGLLQRGPAATLVLRATPDGCEVVSGEVKLPPRAVMLLTGRGAHFHGVTFTGGVVVCCGEACSVSFQSCIFSQCQVYAVHGAAVTLRRCSFRQRYSAVIASGPTTTLHLHSCRFQACDTAFTVERGAAVAASRCTAWVVRGVIVRDPGSHAALDWCSFHGVQCVFEVGVLADAGAVSMRHCSMAPVMRGIVATGSAVVEVHHSHIEARICAVSSSDNARVLLRESYALVPAQPHKVPSTAALYLQEVSGGLSGPQVQVERCCMLGGRRELDAVHVECGAIVLTLTLVSSAKKGKGVAATGIGSRGVVLRDCDVRSPRGIACMVEGAGCGVVIKRGRVSGADMALFLKDGALAAVRGAALSGGGDEGGTTAKYVVLVGNASCVQLLNSTVQRATIGVHVVGGRALVKHTEVSQLCASEARPEDMGRSGAGFYVEDGDLAVQGGAVRGCSVGALVCKLAPGQAAEFESTLFDENLVGVRVAEGGGVRVWGCEFRVRQREGDCIPATKQEVEQLDDGHEALAAVAVESMARGISVEQCTFLGYDVDVWSMGSEAIHVRGCTFLGEYAAAARVTLHSPGVVEDCTFVSAVDAVVVDCAQAGCTVRGCRFEAGALHGVSITGEGKVNVVGCAFAGGEIGVMAVPGTSVSIRDCEMAGTEVGVRSIGAASLELRRTTMRCQQTCVEFDDTYRTGTRAVLSECSLEGETGVALDELTVATIERCKVSSCRFGVHVRAGASAQVWDSVITGCECGIDAGKECEENEDGDACDQDGVGVLDSQARQAGKGRPDRGESRLGCVDDGVEAELGLRGVELARCGTGLKVHRGGRVTAKAVSAVDCGTGFEIVRSGHMNVFDTCSVAGATGRAVRAWRQLGPEDESRLQEEEVAGITVSSSAVADSGI